MQGYKKLVNKFILQEYLYFFTQKLLCMFAGLKSMN